MKSKLKKEILDWFLCFLVAYIIYLFINYFIGNISGIKQVSMSPNIKEGEKVIIARRVIFSKKINRGDIVTIEAPKASANISKQEHQAQYASYKGLSWFAKEFMGLGKISYIKRVIATEGEHLFISEEGKVYINDQVLAESYLTENITDRTGRFYDMVVPDGCVFVMGDNRDESKDSREIGAIPIKQVEGKVKLRIWPINKIGAI